MLTQQQARLLCEAHEIFTLLENEEELELLESNNPELFEAYCALHRIAAGSNATMKGGDQGKAGAEKG